MKRNVADVSVTSTPSWAVWKRRLLDAAVDQAAKQFDRTPDEQRQVWQSQYPTQRFTSPQEIADLALFLCSDRAANITGANFVVDGGLTALLPER